MTDFVKFNRGEFVDDADFNLMQNYAARALNDALLINLASDREALTNAGRFWSNPTVSNAF